MAEAALFSVASKLLTTIASSAFEKAFERACSIWTARDELDKLGKTIQSIQAVLPDAEKKQEHSAAAKNWLRRVRDVLYDADDLFDEVAADYLLRKQRIKGDNKILNKVWASCSKWNTIVSNNSISKKVKAIRDSLLDISKDMAIFGFVPSLINTASGSRSETEEITGSYVDLKDCIGRDSEKKLISEMLLNESDDALVVIAIVGIGGMGKTTLAQLVYNDEEIKNKFGRRFFAQISDTSGDKEIYGKIYQSIFREKYRNFTTGELKAKIRTSLMDLCFLLVLDNVWDEDRIRWENRMSILRTGAKGSKVIVTTRSLSVARAVGASEIHQLGGLSLKDSLNLFNRVALTPQHEYNNRWKKAGKRIVKRCANVPLAIKSIAGVLSTKTTIREWRSFMHEELPQLGLGQGDMDHIMHVLKLSYDHLPPNLKHCFAYCSLFPKNHTINKRELIYLWYAQGYIENLSHLNVEEIGHLYFMDLSRRFFFQEEKTDDETGEVETCKMHDLIHDLARHVAGEDTILLTSTLQRYDYKTQHRHLSVGYATCDSMDIPAAELHVNRLRSLLFMEGGSICSVVLKKQLPNFGALRSLSLQKLKFEKLPDMIGELKHLRYLDLSETPVKNLPNSITKLVNLQRLNVRHCVELQALPNDLSKLINLHCLDLTGCFLLKQMPPGLGKLTSLQHLDVFVVGRGNNRRRSSLAQLIGLKLRGSLRIHFDYCRGSEDWYGVECWRPPVNLERLTVQGFIGARIPNWDVAIASVPTRPPTTHNCIRDGLSGLALENCSKVKYLPPFRHLPCLRFLSLWNLNELEYIEEVNDVDHTPYLGCLEELKLVSLKKLKGWWKVEAHSSSIGTAQLISSRSLSRITIDDCPELKSMPLCKYLSTLELKSMKAEMITQLLSMSSFLECVSIELCDDLTSFPGESLITLRSLSLAHCKSLKHVELPPSNSPDLNMLKVLFLRNNPELELWGENNRGLNWDSLCNLRQLLVDEVPSSVRLPECLRRLQALDNLLISNHEL